MMYYDANVLANQVAASGLIVWIIRALKQSRLPWLSWINEHSWLVNRTLSIVAALLVSLGLSYQYSYTPDGVLTLSLSGLTLASLIDHARTWLVGYILQQTGYRVTEPSTEP